MTKVVTDLGDLRCRRQRRRAAAGRAACTCRSTTGSRTGPRRARPRRSRSGSPRRSAAQSPPGRLVASLSHLSGALGIPVPGAGDLDPNTELRQKVAESVWRVTETGGGRRPWVGARPRCSGSIRRRSTCGSTARSSDGSSRAADSRASIRRRRARPPAGHRQGVGAVRATALRPRSRRPSAVPPRPSTRPRSRSTDVVELVADAATAFWERGAGCR